MSRAAPEVLTVQVPFAIRKRGGRKVMVMPDGAKPERLQVDNTMVKALARAFRWKKMLENGEFATIAELAQREKVQPSYLTRILRLTLLAPDIVEGIVAGKPGSEITLAEMMAPFPVAWARINPINPQTSLVRHKRHAFLSAKIGT